MPARLAFRAATCYVDWQGHGCLFRLITRIVIVLLLLFLLLIIIGSITFSFTFTVTTTSTNIQRFIGSQLCKYQSLLTRILSRPKHHYIQQAQNSRTLTSSTVKPYIPPTASTPVPPSDNIQ